jgi:hypothetical protein
MAALALVAAMLSGGVQAQLTPYSQDFEGLDANASSALADDGWLVFGNVFDAEGNFLYNYGPSPFPAPNGGPAFSAIASGDGGPTQGAQYLNVYSDYSNPDHGNNRYIEALVFQEQTIGEADAGKTVSLTFDYRENPSNINDGDSTTFAFIKVIRQSDLSFSELAVVEFDTTVAADWGTQNIELELDPSWGNELLQFGFRSVATNSNDTGRFYDNLQFAEGSPASITVTVDPSETWLGFMNVFNIVRSSNPPTPGAFVFGSPWGFNDLTASFDGSGTLTLGVNTIGDPNEFWYQNTSGTATPPNVGGPGQLGNKWMDANGYVQRTDDPNFSGVNLTFTGTVIENSFTANHSARAFIRDFAPDFSSFQEASVDLTSGEFSVSLLTQAGPGRHVQYGFNVAGENVWISDAAAFGTILVGNPSAPEPTLVNSGIYHNGFGGAGSPPWNAVDTAKTLAARGGSPVPMTFQNLINASNGITGIILDFENLSQLEELEFQFKWSDPFLGAIAEVDSWSQAPEPSSATLHLNEGEGGSNRVLILWPENTIANRYLSIQVSVGGVSQAELFVGHLLGETTGPTDGLYTVAFADIGPIRSSAGQTVDAGSSEDVDKSGTVSFADISAMRGNIGAQLPNITLPSSGL